MLTILVLSNRGLYLDQSDADIYRSAGSSLWHTDGHLYHLRFGTVRMPFTYPPFAALVFSVVAGLPFVCWQIALAVIGAAAVLVAVLASYRIAGCRPTLAPVVLIVALCLWLEPVDLTLYFGQVNLILLGLVLVDLATPDDRRWKGVGIGLAAAVKLTPLIFIPYLWLTGRRRAAATSLGVFVAAGALALVLRPRDSVSFWRGQAFSADDARTSLNQSLDGLLQRLLGHCPAATGWWLGASAIVICVGLAAATCASRAGQELLAVTSCGAIALLVSPISWTHHYVWVVPVLVLIAAPGSWTVLRTLAAGALVVVFGWWPLPVADPNGGYSFSAQWHPSGLLRATAHGNGLERHWTFFQFLAGNLYVWAALAYLAYALARAHRGTARVPDLTARPVQTSVSS